MQKDSIEAMHQNRNPLVQEAGLSSLASVFRNPPSKIIIIIIYSQNRLRFRVFVSSRRRVVYHHTADYPSRVKPNTHRRRQRDADVTQLSS